MAEDKQTVSMELFNSYVKSIEEGNPHQIIANLEEILRIAPNWEHGEGWMELGSYYLDEGDALRALECIDKARYQASLMYNLDYCLDPFSARALAAAGRLEESMEMLMRFLPEEVSFANQSGQSQLNRALTEVLTYTQERWQLHNFNLFERLAQEIPEGAHFWTAMDASD
jgi:tetratricopeptide (TPR) repeat protein